MRKSCLNFTLYLLLLFPAAPLLSQEPSVSAEKLEDLEWGTVLFDYYSGEHFNALVEYQYNAEQKNPQALSDSGRLLNGGMSLSYGLAEEASQIFSKLLDSNPDEALKNQVWLHLAEINYHKGNLMEAEQALSQISANRSKRFDVDYLYRFTTVAKGYYYDEASAKRRNIPLLSSIDKSEVLYPYMAFNIAVRAQQEEKSGQALEQLKAIIDQVGTDDELSQLVDRSRHAMAKIALEEGKYSTALGYLKKINTNGIYSNRSLLTYSWLALENERFQEALPALQLLNKRSIALPEVQEGKMLLVDLYRRNGDIERSMAQLLQTIEAFNSGLSEIKELRAITSTSEIPRQFAANLDQLVVETDWFGQEPTLNYKRATPYLIDLLASKSFNEALNELADLYAIEKNLKYWSKQAMQHTLVMTQNNNKRFGQRKQDVIARSGQLRLALQKQLDELILNTLTVEPSEQDKLKITLDDVAGEMELLEARLDVLNNIYNPYRHPRENYISLRKLHGSIGKKQWMTRKLIIKVEDEVRKMINLELDKQESRIQQYLAHTKIGKAKLYDLLSYQEESKK